MARSLLFILIITLMACEPGKIPVRDAKHDYKARITLVIHGGAGTITKGNMTPEQEASSCQSEEGCGQKNQASSGSQKS